MIKTALKKYFGLLGYDIQRNTTTERTRIEANERTAEINSLKSTIEQRELESAAYITVLQREINSLKSAKEQQNQKSATAIADVQKQLNDQLNILKDEKSNLIREAAIRYSFVNTVLQYFVHGERGSNVVVPLSDVKNESNPDWIPEMLSRTAPVEPEFAVFSRFTDPEDLILDIGANYGYSATSIWAVGSPVKILSFEPNENHLPCLARIAELKPGQYDFVNTALGDTSSHAHFITPVIGGVAASGLTSGAFEKSIAWAAQENFVRHALMYCKDIDSPTLRFAEHEWRVQLLDDVLEKNQFKFSVDRIVAIKIDVEGYEYSALHGATKTLRRYTPLILIESANRVERVCHLLASLGYLYADFDGQSSCVLTAGISPATLGFFLHTSQLARYRQLGILKDS